MIRIRGLSSKTRGMKENARLWNLLDKVHTSAKVLVRSDLGESKDDVRDEKESSKEVQDRTDPLLKPLCDVLRKLRLLSGLEEVRFGYDVGPVKRRRKFDQRYTCQEGSSGD